MTTYEEWRVTGDSGKGLPPYNELWSGAEVDDPETAARAWAVRRHGWTDGPHLHKRTVTVTEWTEVDA